VRNCSVCKAPKGGHHVLGCSIERCALCGAQAISCGCVWKLTTTVGFIESAPTEEEMWGQYDAEVQRYGGRLPWEGEFPGSKECREYNLYCYWDSAPNPAQPLAAGKWVQCSKDHPSAQEDLNTLHSRAVWDKVARRWLLKPVN
jgi:hypothetical protein